MANEYWGWSLLDQAAGRNPDEREVALSRLTASKTLRSQIEQLVHESPLTSQAPEGTYSLLAGSAIDLSGGLDCPHWECRRKQVDTLFSHAWHYFDQVAVASVDHVDLLESWDEDEESNRYWLEHHLRTLAYLRDIGAEDLVTFVPKFAACSVHLEEALQGLDLGPLWEKREALTEKVATEGRFVVTDDDHETHVEFEYEPLGLWRYATTDRDRTGIRSDEELRWSFAAHLIDSHLAHLAGDIRAAREFGLPLAEALPFHRRMLQEIAPEVTAPAVAFSIELPVLRDLPVQALLSLRQQDSIGFERFRHAMHQAIREQAAASSGSDPYGIAREIEVEVIKPELARIEKELREAGRTLETKHKLNTGIAVVATVCGLLGISPLAVALTTTCIASATAAEREFVQRREEISLDDMYFLWESQEAGKRH